MFKAIIPAVVLASALAFPALANAQNNGPVTRAQVKAELIQLEKAGYDPASDQVDYPENLQAAQRRVNAQNAAAASGYGASTDSRSASGSHFVRPVSNVNPVDYNRP
ncbi:hypothetical protein BGLT_05278 [Caballeronia glathei]|jgi:hypothetical protein|uniref:Purine nucleoside phosphorylase n=1 Tax=Caballeronia glathei TaxID=60547 RepID=A0A069PCP2_9BURK|nr:MULTISPECIES: DUF4148 domain-containing protein [Burkholderiaceae]KDR38468.1 hypothetical protein BG61_39740 [Caballeronia glathei]TCK35048.1 uncharacterized protein DUF4148 [Paraburkholderia sp. BL8N3]CDY76205.1 hypothetical protein BGLT_05278 [Caballeronia glathei]